jgi:hypothetical protein
VDCGRWYIDRPEDASGGFDGKTIFPHIQSAKVTIDIPEALYPE